MSTHLFRIAAFLLAACVWHNASADTPTYNMPRSDGKKEAVTVTESLLFYDHGGPTSSLSSTWYTTLCTFHAAEEGETLSITFNSLEVNGATVYIYDGEQAKADPVPEGYIGSLTGTVTTPVTFDAPSGTLSVLYHSKTSGISGAGWEALIEATPSKDMEWVSATGTSALGAYIYPGATDVPLMRIDLLTDGGNNPLSLSSINFALANVPQGALANLRCVINRDASSPKGGEQFGDTYASAQENMAFNGNSMLKSKHNYAWLVADIPADAAPGSSFSPSCTSASVSGENRISTPIGAESPLVVKNMLFMPVGPATYSIGSDPLLFFDDGGPEGNITLNFAGQVTFVPANPGKKVRIVFESLDLFNTSSVGYNDVLNIYNGTSIDAANLAANLLNTPLTVHSTAADGALTVEFRSLTGVNPKSGWSARVEEFEPQPMTVSALNLTPAADLSAAAGDAAQMLTLDFTTTGTEPAATLNSLSLSTEGSTAAISSVEVKNAAGKSLGAVAPSNETFTLSLPVPALLGERDNIFYIYVTPATSAESGQTISLALNSATMSTGTALPTATASAQATINNICLLTQGEHSHTVSGSWTLANEPASNQYIGYDGAAGKRQVTLTPAHSGKYIELEFDSFYVNWPNWGNAPSFKVYSGTTAAGTPLWTMTQAQAKTGPEIPLRSTAADGSMTIVFDPNGNNGAKGNGFTGTVREYVPEPMQLASVEVTQAGTDPVMNGDADVPMLRIAVTTTGDLNPLPLEELIFDLKDAAGSVKTAKLYFTAKNDAFTAGTPIASAEVTDEMTSVTLTPAATVRLSEKTGYYWLAYDMKESIEPGHMIDASLTSMKVNGQNVSGIITPDPEGCRESVAVYLFGGADEIVDVKGTLLFYDDGGADGKYTTTHKGRVTFRPQPGELIKFSFKDFYTNVSDYFYVYDGSSTEGTLRAKLSSEKTGLTDIFSTAADGSLTVDFNPAKNNINRGWHIEVSSVAPDPLHITAATLTKLDNVRLLRGAEDLPVARLELKVEGNKGPVVVTEFGFDTTGTSSGLLSGLSLTSSGALDTYNDVNVVALGDGGNLIASDHELTEPGTFYYWLRADLSAEAENDDALVIALNSVKSGDSPLWNNLTDKVEAKVEAGLKGTYILGNSDEADFPTIKAATDALAKGVEGAVTILIEPGEYQELVTIPEIPGASEAHPVTLRSSTGNRDDVTISYNRYTNAGYGAPEYGVMTVHGADWLTLESLTVTTTDTSFPMLVKLENAARHFTMRDCRVWTTPGTGYNDPTLVECYVSSEQIPDRNNDYATFSGCSFEGGYIGLQLGGTGIVNPVPLPRERGGRVSDCSFTAQASKGLYISSENFAVIERNYFESASNAATSYYALDLYNLGEGSRVEGNSVVHAFGKSSSSGIYLRPATGTQENPVDIINNEVSLTNASSALRGIIVNSPSPYVRIAHNTVAIEGNAPSSACFYLNDTMLEGEIANNIFINNAAGYAVRVQKTDYLTAPFRSNLMHSSAEGMLAYIAADVADIEAWADAASDVTSFDSEVNFLRADILEPITFETLRLGTPLPYVTRDISGLSRSADTPAVGAYENAEMAAAPALAESYPAVDRITHESARLLLMADCHGEASILLTAPEAAAPTADSFADSDLKLSLRNGREAALHLTGLEPNTDYRPWILLSSLRGTVSTPIAGNVFSTSYVPTAVSTFEAVKPSEVSPGAFTDGTALFRGFIVEEQENLPIAGSTKVAIMEDTETLVTLTNASNLTLDGFWLSNPAPLTLTVMEADGEGASKTLPADSWRYVNLRDMGEISNLRLYSEEPAMIDDFSGQPAPLTVAVNGADARVAHDSDVTLTAATTGGVAPFSYSWTDSLREEIGSESSLSLTADYTTEYALTVTDAWGNTSAAATRLYVDSEQVIADFEDLWLAPDTNWCGDTTDPDYSAGTFLSGTFAFTNYYNAEWSSWAGFGYSSLTGTEFSSFKDDMVCAAGTGHDSDRYGVVFMSAYYGPVTMQLTNATDPQTIPGLWLTNTEWVKESVLNGDGMSDKFEKGDYCAVRIFGMLPDGTETEPLEIPLADYRAADSREWYVLDTWQWHSLETLGAVSGLRWEFTSTKRNAYGITTPAYACLDDLGDTCPWQTLDAMTVTDDNRAIPLADLFSFEADAPVTYTLLEGDARISGNELIVTAPELTSTTLRLSATSRGCRQWIELPVEVDTSAVETIDASEITLIEIFDLAGICLHRGPDMPNLPAGIYLIVRHTPTGAHRKVERR
ncbi:MAG: DUF4465 domain-containing protein [Bacteroidales bacterium]|nr:DUF4465 domain-containing protein [Bacteroidales bacterium]